MNATNPGALIGPLALPEEDADELRRQLDEWHAVHEPTSPIERGWVEQAVAALIEGRRCLRLRASLQAEKVRTAVLHWEQDREDEVQKYARMFNVDPAAALVGLRRSAAGCRYLVARWERLEKRLADEATWYGCDRIEAIQLQGLSAVVEDLYFSETAYLTWLYCLSAQPNPKPRDIELVCRPDVIPKALQDKDLKPWRPEPAHSRRQLHELVARELPPLRAREQRLRIEYEEPARAAATAHALARITRDEMQLIREVQMHERSFQRASAALLKVRRRPAGSAPTSGEWLVLVPAIDPAVAPATTSQKIEELSHERS